MRNITLGALVSGLALASLACRHQEAPRIQLPAAPVVPAYYTLSQETFGDGQALAELLADQPLERISLWRSGCYGSCPIFRVDFFRDGRAVYTGEEYVENIGSFEVEDTLGDFAMLAANVEAMGLLELEPRYEAGWTDDETVTVELAGDFGVKRIEDYGHFGPPLLEAFHALVDSRVERITWR